jgi:hypothetical protein
MKVSAATARKVPTLPPSIGGADVTVKKIPTPIQIILLKKI